MQTLSNNVKHNRGAALVIALILLAAITVVGLSNIQSSTLQMKMIISAATRVDSFNAHAEAALKNVETLLTDTMNLSENDLTTDACSAGKCFVNDCTDGLCFEGEYTVSDDKIDCQISPDADTTERIEFWSDPTLAVWSNSGKHKTITVAGDTVKYIIEFLCFIGRNDGSSFDVSSPNNGDPLFRITVFNDSSLSPVVLQSTYAFAL